MMHTQDNSLPRRRLPPRPRRRPLIGLAISLATLAALIALALMLAGGTDPTLTRLTTATALDDAFEPVQVTDTFKPGDTFFVSTKIANYRSDQSIRARWRFNGDKIDETPLTTNGTQGSITAGFSLSSAQPWPAGRYTVEIMYGDKVLGTTQFSVKP